MPAQNKYTVTFTLSKKGARDESHVVGDLNTLAVDDLSAKLRGHVVDNRADFQRIIFTLLTQWADAHRGTGMSTLKTFLNSRVGQGFTITIKEKRDRR